MPRSSSAPTAPDLLVFGEFYFDLVFYDLPILPQMGLEVRTDRYAEAPGGGLATTAMVAAALGTKTGVVTRVGAEAPLHAAWQRLKALRITTDACELRRDFSTALTVCAAYRRDRMMITHDPINERLGELMMLPRVQRVLRGARHVHFAFPFRRPGPWLYVLDDLRSRGVTTSADIGWNPDVLKSKYLPRVLRRLDLFFPNESEACAITGDSSPFQAARNLARRVRIPVVKLGKRGSVAFVDGKVLRVPALPVRVVDATGAGDAYDGGFLHAFVRGRPWLECMRTGSICGGIATTAPGGTGVLPSAAKLRALLGVLGKAVQRRG